MAEARTCDWCGRRTEEWYGCPGPEALVACSDACGRAIRIALRRAISPQRAALPREPAAPAEGG